MVSREEIEKSREKLMGMTAYELMTKAEDLYEKINKLCNEAELPPVVITGIQEHMIDKVQATTRQVGLETLLDMLMQE